MDNQRIESDWKTFRLIVPELRGRYLRVCNAELISILQGESSTPTEKFWTASERMDEIGKILRVCLDDHKRSTMMHSLMEMYNHKMITDEDLNGFSEEVRSRISILSE